jgi:hypothetical protein
MNPRHAAALALVGWYLMAPPVTFEAKDKMITHPEAALDEWDHEGSYGNANDCAEALEDWHKQWDPPNQSDLEHRRMAWAAHCVATDDPRLRRK